MTLEHMQQQLEKAESNIEAITHNANQLFEIIEKLPVKNKPQMEIKGILKAHSNKNIAGLRNLCDLIEDIHLSNCDSDLELLLAELSNQ